MIFDIITIQSIRYDSGPKSGVNLLFGIDDYDCGFTKWTFAKMTYRPSPVIPIFTGKLNHKINYDDYNQIDNT